MSNRTCVSNMRKARHCGATAWCSVRRCSHKPLGLYAFAGEAFALPLPADLGFALLGANKEHNLVTFGVIASNLANSNRTPHTLRSSLLSTTWFAYPPRASGFSPKLYSNWNLDHASEADTRPVGIATLGRLKSEFPVQKSQVRCQMISECYWDFPGMFLRLQNTKFWDFRIQSSGSCQKGLYPPRSVVREPS
jgi:hypothetical protein